MKFVISSGLLSARLQTLGRVIIPKNSMPILETFRFTVSGQTLTVTASDPEIWITTNIELENSEGDIDFTVSARTIQDAIKEIPDQPLTFYVNTEEHHIVVEYQNGKYDFTCDGAEEYPECKTLASETVEIDSPSHILFDGINRALFAAADDQLRPQMNGIFFELNEQGLAMVASDGRKMACTKATGVTSEQQASFILPKKPANLLKPILAKEEEATHIAFTGKNAVFTTPNYTLFCRLIEGRFPNYNSVIPSDNPNHVIVNRAAMISALRRVLVMSTANNSLVKLQAEPNRVTISAQDIDYAMGGEEWLIADYMGPCMSIGFKGALLIELLNNMTGDDVIFQLAQDGSRAGVIVPAQQPEEEDILMLIMPLMLND